MENAYNDAQGVTGDFNKNLLHRINRELEADFNVQDFRHRAHFNHQLSRIEMHLISSTNCTVRIGEEVFSFQNGESIHTENSYKYNPEDFIALASQAGFHIVKRWTDKNNYFNVFLFVL